MPTCPIFAGPVTITNAVGKVGMRAGDGKQGINKCWPYVLTPWVLGDHVHAH